MQHGTDCDLGDRPRQCVRPGGSWQRSGIGAAIDAIGGSFTMRCTTVAVTAALL